MNVPCRDNLCALQKEAWLPGGADPWAELGFQPCRWLLERGNPVQHSQACSEIWDLLMAAASPLWESCTRCVWECAESHWGKAAAVLRIVSSVGLRQELQCSLWRRISQMCLSAPAFGLPLALKSQSLRGAGGAWSCVGSRAGRKAEKCSQQRALGTHIPSLHPWWVPLERRKTLVGIMGEGRALQPHFVNPISLVLM